MEEKVVHIGVIRTPYANVEDCPRNVTEDGPECRVELYKQYARGLFGVEDCKYVQLLYWMGRAERRVGLIKPPSGGEAVGNFALRTPVRPNPIGSGVVPVVRVEGNSVIVRGLDCVDGTALLDIKMAKFVEVSGKTYGV